MENYVNSLKANLQICIKIGPLQERYGYVCSVNICLVHEFMATGHLILLLVTVIIYLTPPNPVNIRFPALNKTPGYTAVQTTASIFSQNIKSN